MNKGKGTLLLLFLVILLQVLSGCRAPKESKAYSKYYDLLEREEIDGATVWKERERSTGEVYERRGKSRKYLGKLKGEVEKAMVLESYDEVEGKDTQKGKEPEKGGVERELSYKESESYLKYKKEKGAKIEYIKESLLYIEVIYRERGGELKRLIIFRERQYEYEVTERVLKRKKEGVRGV